MTIATGGTESDIVHGIVLMVIVDVVVAETTLGVTRFGTGPAKTRVTATTTTRTTNVDFLKDLAGQGRCTIGGVFRTVVVGRDLS